MVLQWSHASLIPVVNVPTTPMLDVRSTTVVGAMLSTMMTEAIMSLISVAHQQHVRMCIVHTTQYCCIILHSLSTNKHLF